MTPKLIDVVSMANYEVLLTYENNEKRIFNLTPYLNTGLFSELKNEDVFQSVKISFDTIEWVNGIDIDPEELYKNSRKLKSESIA
jgi:hypothetical protein